MRRTRHQLSDCLGLQGQTCPDELLDAAGARRVELFISMLDTLGQCKNRLPLASGEFCAEPVKYLAGAMNHVLVHIRENFTSRLYESELPS